MIEAVVLRLDPSGTLAGRSAMNALVEIPISVLAGMVVLILAPTFLLIWVVALVLKFKEPSPIVEEPCLHFRPPRKRRHLQTVPVRPRVVLPASGETLPLASEIRNLLQDNRCGAVRLIGGAGSGKTTALQHLAVEFYGEPRFRALEEPDPRILHSLDRSLLVVYTTAFDEIDDAQDLATYHLAPWNRDDLIEYLLAVEPEACASVMERIRTTGPLEYEGCPEIWRVILDALAVDPAIPNARAALSHYLQWLEPDLQAFIATGRAALDRITCDSPEEYPDVKDCDDEFARLLRHRDVQILVAAEQLLEDLQKSNPPSEEFLARYFPRKLVQETASLLLEDVQTLSQVLDFLDRPLRQYSLLVSLLHAAEIEWQPAFANRSVLKFAYLEGVQWPAVDLGFADLSHADFRKACLSLAHLDGANGRNADFRGAYLTGALMRDGVFLKADFSGADCSSLNAHSAEFADGQFVGTNFRGANLSRAGFQDANLQNANFENADLSDAMLLGANLQQGRFVGANLSRAILTDACLEDANFSGANLNKAYLSGLCLRGTRFDGANFREAHLEQADLEEFRCENVNFESANLTDALLTASQFIGANLANANLRGARLAEISWEGACLRNVDLRGATFHMGSTRCGLLFTGIASEGTRTGFYTDEYEEQSFRAPEEIRKANLCGADLRGAKFDNVDFYLVDLRGAMYDLSQADYLRRCGAIL